MIREQNERTSLLIGEEAVERLISKSVAVFGIGGVGGHAADALARAGVGRIALFDNDRISESNINRQLIAVHSTIGMQKVDVMKRHILDICPDTEVETYPVFYLPENADNYSLEGYDYIIDAIDTVSAKLEIIIRASKLGIPVVSAMGAGNKLDPTAFEVADIYKTSVCPLAKVMRKELRARGIEKLKVVYSRELVVKTTVADSDSCGTAVKKRIPGSISFVPSVAGLIIAGEVIKDLIKKGAE